MPSNRGNSSTSGKKTPKKKDFLKNPPKYGTPSAVLNSDEVCPICCDVVKDEDRALQCEGKCTKWYHCGCAGVSRSFYEALSDVDSWMCSPCKEKSARLDGSIPLSQVDGARNEKIPEIPHILTLKVDELNPSIQLVASKLNDIITTLMSLKDSVVFQSKQFDTFNLEMKKIKEENTRILTKFEGFEEVTKRLKAENDLLTIKINALEQSSIKNELEINGIPETPNENPTSIVQSICKKLNCALDDRDVLMAYRPRMRDTGKMKVNHSPIVVVLQDRFIRQRIMDSKKAYGVLTCKDVEIKDRDGRITDRKVYINEKLTHANKHLFWLARKTKDIGYKYCWVKNGHIFVKYNDTSRPLLILKETDVPLKAPGRDVGDSKPPWDGSDVASSSLNA